MKGILWRGGLEKERRYGQRVVTGVVRKPEEGRENTGLEGICATMQIPKLTQMEGWGGGRQGKVVQT
jgi:hypothetical protein